MDINPGATISIEIAALPRSEAARKTLLRVCAKDPGVAQRHRRQKSKRPSWQTWRRGGRDWHHQMRSEPAAKLVRGAKFTVRATVDVLRDLNSVSKWIKLARVAGQ